LIVVMVPGVILALTGRFYVIGWLTGAVLLLNFVILRFMAWKQDAVWDNSGLKRYRDPVGLAPAPSRRGVHPDTGPRR
jgi:hypothetical protein